MEAPVPMSASATASMPPLGDRNEQRGAVERTVGNRDSVGKSDDAVDGCSVPTGDTQAPDFGLGHHGVGRHARDHEDRQTGRVIGALDERQPGNDFRRGFELEGRPPRPGAGDGESGDEAEIAFGSGDRLHDVRRSEMRHQWHREAEVEARDVAHESIAG